MQTQRVKTAPVNTDFEVRSLRQKEEATLKQNAPSSMLYVVMGICFGILLVKSEVISWYRIQEMFRLQNIHMFGVIGSAVATGMLSVWLIKKFNIKTIAGENIELPKTTFHQGQVWGGLIFGFGWAITGACPGPLFAQIGAGFGVVFITLLSAIGGTWVYGLIRDRLPH